MQQLGLRLDTLEFPWEGLNWYEKVSGRVFRHFVYDTVAAKTPVYVDPRGVARYIQRCCNLMTSISDCPGCQYVRPADTLVAQPTVSVVPSLFPDPLNINLRVSGSITLEGGLLSSASTEEIIIPPILVTKAGVRWYQRTRYQIGMGVVALALGGGIYKCATDWCDGGDINIFNHLVVKR
ncbi:MAG: hypothetical protein AAB690_01380 [Patescibacteria group bacterium]